MEGAPRINLSRPGQRDRRGIVVLKDRLFIVLATLGTVALTATVVLSR